MRTFLQLLRIGFWMLPVQRWLVVLGAALCLSSLIFDFPFGLPGSTLPAVFLGVALMLITPILAGGAFFRMLAAPRLVLLLPHGKGRLLAGMIGICLLATLLWIVAYYSAFLRLPLHDRPGSEAYVIMYVLTLSFATQCSIGLFIASLGPAWSLVTLAAWQAPSLVLALLGVDSVPRLLAGPVGLAMVPVTWAVFGTWFLRTRRISAPGWHLGTSDAANTLASSAGADTMPRETAMSRWLLGPATPLRISLQWLCGVALLVGVQLALGHESPPRSVNAMLFGTLSLSAIVIGSIAATIAGRSRGLWLTAGRSRLQLHSWCERLMLRVAGAIALPFLLLGVLIWYFLPSRPALPGAYLLVALLAPGLGAAWFGLMQLHRRVALDALAGLLLVLGWYYGLIQPLYLGSDEPRWGVAAAQLALAVLLREVALVRWRAADWPRGQRVAPLA